MRNRIRPDASTLPLETKLKLLDLRNQQADLAEEINYLSRKIIPHESSLPRQIFRDMPDNAAVEILRLAISDRLAISCTRPQLHDFLNAIRTYQPGKYFNLPGGKLVRIDKTSFML